MTIKQIIPFLEENKKEIKVHCSIGEKKKEDELEAFFKGEFEKNQALQTKKNFERKYILSLVYIKDNEWLFVGIYESLGAKENPLGGYVYDTKLTDIASEFIGKLIIGFEKKFRASYLCLENYIDRLQVIEIKRDIIKPIFPGYDKVNVTWNELKARIDTESWKTALENLKGVYLITDTKTGKRYVGSAYGDNMLWGRWKDYINTGHGGNVELKGLEFEYIKDFFTYTILEIFKSTTDSETIIGRESWWKNVLLTREKKYGYNQN